MRKIIIDLNSIDSSLFYKELVRQGENLASELIIKLNEEFQNYKYQILFQNNEKTPVVTSELIPVDNIIDYIISNALTGEVGTLKIELQAYDLATGLLMKTAKINLRVIESINGDMVILPEAYVPWYATIVQKENEINIKLDALKITTWQNLIDLGV